MERDITRRQFLQLMLTAGIGVGAVGLAMPEIGDIGKVETIRAYPEGGWLETSLPNRPDFIDMTDGHKNYLRAICLKSPVVRSALKSAYNDLFYNRNVNPKLGDLFQKHITFAKKSLKEIQNDNNPSLENCVHIATSTLAAVLSPYFTFGEINDLGAPLNIPLEKRNTVLKPLKLESSLRPDFMPQVFLPRVYSAKMEQCKSYIDSIARCLGGDRSIHFAQHMFLTHQYLYAQKYRLKDHTNIPFFVKPFISLGISNIGKAGVLDFLAGMFWEVKETYDQVTGHENKDVEAKGISQGYLDSAVDHDIMANGLGFRTAVDLFRDEFTDLTLEDVQIVIDKLNSPEIRKVSKRESRIGSDGEALLPLQIQSGVNYPIYSTNMPSPHKIYNFPLVV